MFCDRCGTEANEPAAFCSNCGKALAAASPAPVSLTPARASIDGHIRLMGILWLVVAALRLIPGLVLIVIFSNPFFPPGAPPFARVLMSTVGLLFLIGGALGIITGCGLLLRQPWGRMMAIIVGGLSLADIPFGTALGIYTLWVLLPAESQKEYGAIPVQPGSSEPDH